MMTFRQRRLQELSLPSGLIRLMIEIAESKGRQQLYEKQAPRLLRVLRTAALHQSVQSSTRLDGVTIPPERLLPLIAGTVTAQSQTEGQVRGYAQALKHISADAPNLPITPDFLRRLQAVILERAAGAGKWKG